MSLLTKLLPVILISIIFYLLFYNLYPQYQEILRLVQKLNELRNKEKEIKAMEKLIQNFSQNANIQQLLANKETLNLWLPTEPKIEELIFSLNSIYNLVGLTFEGTDFGISDEPKTLNQHVLPVKIINFKLEADLKQENLRNFIEALEKNVRLMVIKKASLSPEKESFFEVESYFMPLE